jgi:hypothetical protein
MVAVAVAALVADGVGRAILLLPALEVLVEVLVQ